MGSLVAPALALFLWLFHCIFLFVSLGLQKRHKMEEFQKTLEAERAEKKATGARFTSFYMISGLSCSLCQLCQRFPVFVKAKMRTKTRRCD
jgi:hypothetical protein